MHAATLLRDARRHSGLTLRRLAARAQTSHATLSAYETGRVDPSVDTLQRIVRAAGFDVEYALTPRVGGDPLDDRGRELVEVLELAALFPARHDPELRSSRFGAA
ncbi:MAG: helix-turn-helix domain-containing protein [Acidimicrobiales bacterium]